MKKSSMFAVGGVLVLVGASFGQTFHDEGTTFANPDAPRVPFAATSGSGDIRGCTDFAFESGDATNTGSGRTTGAPGGGDRWTPYQPFTLNDSWEICSVGLDGWYVTGSPITATGVIYLADAGDPTLPDLGSPVVSFEYELPSNAGAVHWVDTLIDPTCLEAGTAYVFGAETTGDHWSAIYNAPNGDDSYSIRNGDFGTRFWSGPLAFRLKGVLGCGNQCPADCDGDGTLNTLDFLCFLNAFNTGDAYADYNGDGTINTLDFLAYLNDFAAGCE